MICLERGTWAFSGQLDWSQPGNLFVKEVLGTGGVQGERGVRPVFAGALADSCTVLEGDGR